MTREGCVGLAWGHGARLTSLALVAAISLAVSLHGFACADVHADELRAHVTRVRDGDSMEMRRGSTTVRVRVFGVDAPERGQPWSSRARQFTAGLVGNREVVVRVKDRDRYGRTVGEVILTDGRNLGEELVRAGLAWHYRVFSNDPTLARLEADARAAGRGLWSDPHPTPPWEFRRAIRDGK